MFLNSIIPQRFSVLFIYPFEFALGTERFMPDLFHGYKVLKNYYWKHTYYNHFKTPLHYNEYLYFYTYIREIIFDKEENKLHNVLYYQLMHKETEEKPDLIYAIESTEKETFQLPIMKICLHLFDSGIGFLLFHIEDNSKKHTIQYCLEFVNMGRRLYPSYLAENDSLAITNKSKNILWKKTSVNAFTNMDCPVKIILTHGKEEITSHNFSQFRYIEENNIIRGLIGKARYDFKTKHILDDRMISLCYYEFPEKGKNNSNVFRKSLSDFFSNNKGKESINHLAALSLYYQLLFIDPGSPSCFNLPEMKRIIDISTYKRWIPGSIYGFSRFSCVFITTMNYIYEHFTCMYYRMAILIFFYRSMLLKFSKRSSVIAQKLQEEKKYKTIINELQELKKDFILFSNKFWFKEVTPHDQGIEIFNLWESVVQVNTLLADVKQEIDEMYSYINLQNDKEINNRLRIISIAGFIFLPLSFVAGIWGIENFNYTQFCSYFTARGIASPGWIFLLMAVIFTSIITAFYFIIRSRYTYKNRKMKTRFIFFLGGHDAEMCEIKKMLKKQKQKIIDNNPTWGAALSHYRKKINKIKKDEIPVFIELQQDISVPEKSIIIDHHGGTGVDNKRTAIKQVADLLGVRLNRWQKHISINDVSYIPGLLEAGLSREEIDKIRRYDRKCQGVTKRDEQLALKAIGKKRNYKNLILVTSGTGKTSPVADALYGQYTNLLVISPNEINFYGSGKIIGQLKKAFPESWCGGNLPEQGYWGIVTTVKNKKEKIITDIKRRCKV